MNGGVQLRCEPENTGHRAERQLQADACRRKGILQQDQKKREGKRRRRIALTLEKRREQHQYEHHTGADNGRRRADHERIKAQYGDRDRGKQLSAVRADQKFQQRQQKRAVQTGNGGNVIDARFAEIDFVLFAKAAPVPKQDRAQERLRPLRENRRNDMLRPMRQLLREIMPRRAGLFATGFLPAVVKQQIAAPCGKGRDVAFVDP